MRVKEWLSYIFQRRRHRKAGSDRFGYVHSGFLPGFQYAAIELVSLNGFEQGSEISLSKAFVFLALNEFEKNRADHGFREDLQQQAGVAVVKQLHYLAELL